jgi:hypothetical protein
MTMAKAKRRKVKQRDDSKKSRMELEKEALASYGTAQGKSYRGLATSQDDSTATRLRNLLLLRAKNFTTLEIADSLRISEARVLRLLEELDAIAANVPPAPKGRPRKDRLTGRPSARASQKRNK